ncbi:hypothetical protein WISP_146848 [Willisornis vidua]|uniref:Uncharacterized protein n=1 Tax=Willisornis vidua TaxID=1566151 RepID=A0ABQ9CKN1_9PASS|nr:hypothetical protein WISP_146848 [Willisornis vidua]
MPSRGTWTGLRGGPVQTVKFNKAKGKVLHLDWGNPKHKYRLGGEHIESSPGEKGLGMLVDRKFSMTQQCTQLAVQKANCVPVCIQSSVASRLRELYLLTMTPYGMEYPLGQLGSAVSAVSPLNSSCTPSLLTVNINNYRIAKGLVKYGNYRNQNDLGSDMIWL